MEEIWKDVPGFEGLYQASSFGQVKSIDRIEFRKNNSEIATAHSIKAVVLKQKITNTGYATIVLSRSGKPKYISVHRVIALTFVSNPENKPQVNHIDGNKLNNCIGNLEWCTPKENINHSWRIGLSKSAHGEKNHRAKITDVQATEIRQKYFAGVKPCIILAEYNISRSRLHELKTRKVFKHVP